MNESIVKLPQMRTIDEIAAEFGLAKHFVRQAVLSAKVVHVRAGKKYLINRERFAEWLNNGEQPTQPPEICNGKIRRLH